MPRAKGLEDGQPVQAFVFGLANVLWKIGPIRPVVKPL